MKFFIATFATFITSVISIVLSSSAIAARAKTCENVFTEKRLSKKARGFNPTDETWNPVRGQQQSAAPLTFAFTREDVITRRYTLVESGPLPLPARHSILDLEEIPQDATVELRPQNKTTTNENITLRLTYSAVSGNTRIVEFATVVRVSGQTRKVQATYFQKRDHRKRYYPNPLRVWQTTHLYLTSW
jgi:hypothetical protein